MTLRVALVTGGGGGIGSQVAATLAGAGFAVAVNGINRAAAMRTVQAAQKSGGTARAHKADVGESASVESMVATIRQGWGPVGVLVNNAGNPSRFSLLVDMSDEVRATTLQVHLSVAFYLMRACARRMLKRRWGCIVNMPLWHPCMVPWAAASTALPRPG
jgi:NAD(P)-dependent dehydrogenase (short-subunit alcohol dehydrogenase family)